MSERAAAMGRLTDKLVEMRSRVNRAIIDLSPKWGAPLSNDGIAEVGADLGNLMSEVEALISHIEGLPDPTTQPEDRTQVTPEDIPYA